MKKTARFGYEGFARILARLHWRPASTKQVAESVGAKNISYLRYMMNTLHKRGFIHIREWVKESHNSKGGWSPRWGSGAGEDAPYPGKSAPRMACGKPLPNLIAFMAALECVGYGPATAIEISEYSGIYPSGVRSIIRILREANMVHVAGWAKSSGTNGVPAAQYARGRFHDVPRPAPVTSAESSRRNYLVRRQRLLTLRFIPSLVRLPATHVSGSC